MNDFSRPPQAVLAENTGKGYVGMHIMQGVPILDRDLNLMQDLITDTVRKLVSRYIGNGVPISSDVFAVKEVPGNNDFQISAGAAPPGFCLVSGIEVAITQAQLYTAQTPPGPALTTPSDQDRTDTVYLDVFLETVDTDDILDNEQDIALQTSVRLRPSWAVRVAEGGDVPTDPDPGHTYFPLATLSRKRGSARILAAMITDRRSWCLSLDIVHQLLIRPAITGLSATSGGPGRAVTVRGRNLDLLGQPRVFFGAFQVALADIANLSQTSVDVKVPSAATAGTVKVTISNDGGTAVSPVDFLILGA